MGLFDRLTNPLWHKINSLPSNERDLCVALIVLPGFLRQAVDESLVAPVVRVVTESKISAFEANRKLTPALRERLIDEAVVSLLACCRKHELPQISKKMPPENFAALVAVIALDSISARRKEALPQSLEDAGYSTDRNEAKMQLLVQWCNLLDTRDPSFIEVICKSYFDERWGSVCDAVVSGGLTGFQRAKDTATASAKAVCSSASPGLTAIMEELVRRLT